MRCFSTVTQGPKDPKTLTARHHNYLFLPLPSPTFLIRSRPFLLTASSHVQVQVDLHRVIHPHARPYIRLPLTSCDSTQEKIAQPDSHLGQIIGPQSTVEVTISSVGRSEIRSLQHSGSGSRTAWKALWRGADGEKSRRRGSSFRLFATNE
jgi:hypothetical protein